jgi:hypothetical protein
VSKFCAAHQPPRAGVDPVDTAPSALAVIQLAMHHPARSETIAIVLGDDHRGRSIVVVDGTDDPDSVVAVVERLADSIALSGRGGALVVASIRPGRGPVPGDVDRWLDASDIAEDAGVDLLEWFVIDGVVGVGTAWCPRDLLGEPPRWPRRS